MAPAWKPFTNTLAKKWNWNEWPKGANGAPRAGGARGAEGAKGPKGVIETRTKDKGQEQQKKKKEMGNKNETNPFLNFQRIFFVFSPAAGQKVPANFHFDEYSGQVGGKLKAPKFTKQLKKYCVAKIKMSICQMSANGSSYSELR